MRQTILLASSSPRRRELLEKMGVPFEVRVRNTNEQTDKPAREAVAELAERKAHASAQGLDQGLVLAADTLVSLSGRALGKPRDRQEALDMLRSLSGRAHEVYTGVCLLDVQNGRREICVEETRVFFRALTEEEICAYVDTGEPMDKAGAYGIQGGAGAFVEKIEGSFSNVMGLPTEALSRMLERFS